MSEETMPNTNAVATFKRTGGIIDGSQVARFRRLQQEAAEDDEAVNDPHRPAADDL